MSQSILHPGYAVKTMHKSLKPDQILKIVLLYSNEAS